jgi:hypothetical protein
MSSSSSPPTRSRTGLFLSFRDSTARITHLRHQYDDTNEHDHLIDNSTLLPPQWFVSAVGLSPSIHLPLPGSTTLNKYRRSSQILRQKVCQQLTTISPVHFLSQSYCTRQATCKTRPPRLLGPLSRRTGNRNPDHRHHSCNALVP